MPLSDLENSLVRKHQGSFIEVRFMLSIIPRWRGHEKPGAIEPAAYYFKHNNKNFAWRSETWGYSAPEVSRLSDINIKLKPRFALKVKGLGFSDQQNSCLSCSVGVGASSLCA